MIHRQKTRKSAQIAELISVHSRMAWESDRQRVFVCNPLNLPRILPVGAGKSGMSYGAHDVDHLAANGTGLLGGQVAVITLLQVHAHFCGRSVGY